MDLLDSVREAIHTMRRAVPTSLAESGVTIVVVDTNAFYGDVELRHSAWRSTLLRCREEGYELWVPEVVIQETVRHHARKLEAAVRQMRTGLSDVRALGLDEGLLSGREELEAAVRRKADGYEERLRSTLRGAGARILPLPSTSHQSLLERAMAESKPFRLKSQDPENKGPDGYRDALIWLSIAECASTMTDRDLLVFVTNNHKDFCDGGKEDSSVSAQLLADLPHPGPQVRRCADLRTALGLLPEPSAESASAAGPSAEAGPAIAEQILELVELACEKTLPGMSVEAYDEDHGTGYSFGDLPLPSAMENPTIEYVELHRETLEWAVHDVYEDGTQLATVRVEADVQFDGFAYKSDFAEGLDVHDSDWNDHMMWVYMIRRAVLVFNAAVTPQQEVTDLTFEGGDRPAGERS
ncbi:PIN domain-containing protein [Streptomyces sp. PmtA]|uniref:PIN domain-containing protein n=1 Tax=Streptomyces sp. PmtA TaxID=3074275 RepID=UPI0030144385